MNLPFTQFLIPIRHSVFLASDIPLFSLFPETVSVCLWGRFVQHICVNSLIIVVFEHLGKNRPKRNIMNCGSNQVVQWIIVSSGTQTG